MLAIQCASAVESVASSGLFVNTTLPFHDSGFLNESTDMIIKSLKILFPYGSIWDLFLNVLCIEKLLFLHTDSHFSSIYWNLAFLHSICISVMTLVSSELYPRGLSSPHCFTDCGFLLPLLMY